MGGMRTIRRSVEKWHREMGKPVVAMPIGKQDFKERTPAFHRFKKMWRKKYLAKLLGDQKHAEG